MLLLITGKLKPIVSYSSDALGFASERGSDGSTSSLVDCDRLRFDFNSEALSKEILDLEGIVNEKINENDSVSWSEVQYESIKDRSDIMQFFGDKYGDVVRIVQIGGNDNALDGYSMELCGGTFGKHR